jgi:hypothetical protein
MKWISIYANGPCDLESDIMHLHKMDISISATLTIVSQCTSDHSIAHHIGKLSRFGFQNLLTTHRNCNTASSSERSNKSLPRTGTATQRAPQRDQTNPYHAQELQHCELLREIGRGGHFGGQRDRDEGPRFGPGNVDESCLLDPRGSTRSSKRRNS